MRRIIAIAIAAGALALPRQVCAQRLHAGADSWVSSGDSNALKLGTTLPVRISWTRTEIALATGFTAALLMDAGQTKKLARGGWTTHREANPLLGPTPSVARINVYTAVAGLTVLGAAAALPARVRPWFLGAAFVLEALTVARNARAGISIRIP